jgi:predicted ATPase
MLTEIYVDGYRSLKDLTLNLNPGLNIFVGPNGGGKTNILSFFEFLSRLCSFPVDEAVSHHGGISRVFTRESQIKFATEMNARITGSIPLRNEANYVLHYRWDFQIDAKDNFDKIYFSQQSLYISTLKKGEILTQYDLHVEVSYKDSEALPELFIHTMNVSKLQKFLHGSYIYFDDRAKNYVNKQQARSIFARMFHNKRFSTECIFDAAYYGPNPLGQIELEIRGGEIFNILPSAVKQPDDSSKPGDIVKDGAGLASTLYRIWKDSMLPVSPENFRNAYRIRRKTSIDNINRYINLINPSICGVIPRKDSIQNNISVFVIIKSDHGDIEFPLAHCSDGTIKWIGLVSKLLTAVSGFSIEEPENFLHPEIQKEFVRMVRSESHGSDRSRYTLMTTHSESLLNEANPNELIMVWMEEGRTKNKRLDDSQNVQKEINSTGFGLGYYYSTGALDYA